MPRHRNAVPSYRFHKSSGQAIVTVYRPDGTPRDIALGAYDSPESRARYARICAALRPGGVYCEDAVALEVAEMVAAYWTHAEGYYGETAELKTIRDALRPLAALYGDTPAADFGPRALAAVREEMVRKGWSRAYCNRQAGRIVRAFRWAASEELLPVTVHTALKTLAPLRAGKTAAPETPPVLPADPAAVAATMPRLPPHARALVELLRLTGMRPGEACRMTLGQIDRAGPVWVYTPTRHKNAHRGRGRTVLLGAAAQAVLTGHLGGATLGPDDPVFSPRRQKAEMLAARSASRKTPLYPSHARRLAALAMARGSSRLPGERYTADALAKAVAKGCRRAKVAPWSPYQLRHLVGAELRARFSLEHVRAALGHSHAAMSAHYAKGADMVLAAEVAAKAG